MQPRVAPHGARARSPLDDEPLRPSPVWLYAAGAALGMAIVGSSFAVLDTLRDYPQSAGRRCATRLGAALLVPARRPAAAAADRRQATRLALLAATGLAAFNLLVLAAEASMDPGSVGVIVAAVPVLLALAGPLQEGRRAEPRVLARRRRGRGRRRRGAGSRRRRHRRRARRRARGAGLRGGVLAARGATARAARPGRRVGVGGDPRGADAARRPALAIDGPAGCCGRRRSARRSASRGSR